MKYVALLIFFVWAANASASTDYTCQSECTNHGYSWGYCNSICSY